MPEYSGSTGPIFQLFTSPGHHQPMYWLCRINGPLSSASMGFISLHHLSVELWWGTITHVMLYQSTLTREWYDIFVIPWGDWQSTMPVAILNLGYFLKLEWGSLWFRNWYYVNMIFCQQHIQPGCKSLYETSLETMFFHCESISNGVNVVRKLLIFFKYVYARMVHYNRKWYTWNGKKHIGYE